MKKFISGVFIFSLLILIVYAEHALRVNQEGNVGIGVENPTEKLEVDGRIKDKTGYIMPVGSVLPFFGTQEPEGWLLCDGREVHRNEYADLYEIIGTSCGYGDENTTFNIPDLRGMFLRGVDDMLTPEGAGGRDPDAATRENLKPGGNTGNNVGSKQADALQQHTHSYWKSDNQDRRVESWATSGEKVNDGGDTTVTGIPTGRISSETRPANVAVNYIIKY